MLQQNIWHIAKYQDNKKLIRNLCKRPNRPTANVHCHFPLRNLQPQTCGFVYKFLEEMHGYWKCWQRLDGLRVFPSKNVGEAIEYWRQARNQLGTPGWAKRFLW